MRLQTLHLVNFKGVKDFTLDTQGCDVSVFGENRTGKTTLFDAFLWVLFDKDSKNRKDFEVKTLTPSGEALHNLSHEVEAVLDMDGKALTLRKVYAEKYTRQRGKTTKEFTGHTTDYFINGVPAKKGEYDDRIKAMTDEGVFRLLTNPLYFNECMKWQDRRNLLLEICGNISDQDVIASDKALSRLPEILADYSQDEYKKIIQAKRKTINEEMERIPTRIDEATRSLADITDLIIEELPADIAKLKGAISEKQAEVARIKNGGEIAEKRKRIAEIETEMLDVLRGDREGIEEQIQAKQRELSDASVRRSNLGADISSGLHIVDSCRRVVTEIEHNMAKMREQYATINAKMFEQDTVCPTCGQPIPGEKMQSALESFNVDKAEKLAANQTKGKESKAALDRVKDEIAVLEMEASDARAMIATEETIMGDIGKAIDELRLQSLAHTGGPAYSVKMQEKALLENEIAGLTAGNTAAVAKVQEGITDLNLALDVLLKSQAAVTNNESTEKRIEELKRQEKTLAAEYERLEGELFLCDQFLRTKVELLESKINNKFKIARFKLFSELINGGVEECCVTAYDGVSYPDVNHAGQLALGLDVISTMIDFYGFDAPCFLDNAEAITKIPAMPCQMINLYVSENDKSLRVV